MNFDRSGPTFSVIRFRTTQTKPCTPKHSQNHDPVSNLGVPGFETVLRLFPSSNPHFRTFLVFARKPSIWSILDPKSSDLKKFYLRIMENGSKWFQAKIRNLIKTIRFYDARRRCSESGSKGSKTYIIYSTLGSFSQISRSESPGI